MTAQPTTHPAHNVTHFRVIRFAPGAEKVNDSGSAMLAQDLLLHSSMNNEDDDLDPLTPLWA